jgi:prepilin-type N-terminal cleavage/methylation domain-containing protein
MKMFAYSNAYVSTQTNGSFRRTTSRRGLTLMELVVVMVILVALAGILLPLFPNLLTKAHTSTAATNMSELTKAVQTYYYSSLQYPNNLDNIAGLVGTPGTAPATNPSNANVTLVGAAASSDLSTTTLTATTSAALTNVGITSVLETTVPASAATIGNWTPTYLPYSTVSSTTGIPTPSTINTTVVTVQPNAITREFGYSTAANTATYVLLGLGNYSSMAGTALQEAPIHFDDSPNGEPNVAYCRYGLVFQTTDDAGNALSAAKFIGTVDLGDSTGIKGIGDHIAAYLNTK